MWRIWCLFLVFALTTCFTRGCIDPVPITAQLSLPPEPEPGVFGAMIGPTIGPAADYETPVQFHAIQLATTALQGVHAAHHPTALDMWGRVDVSNERRRCDPADDVQRRVAIAYVVYYAFTECEAVAFSQSPEVVEGTINNMDAFGLDRDVCSGGAVCDVTSAWGLAKVLAAEACEFHSNDGWNALGDLSRSFNKVRFEDFRRRPYTPANSPWKLSKPKRWQPLKETDDRGYISYQEHVTPHIGQTGRSLFLGDDDICSRKAPKPKYKYRQEVTAALERSTQLTDEKKMKIELFDNKLGSIVPLFLQIAVRSGLSLDSYEFWSIEGMLNTMFYEAIMVVWKEKVRWDAVRPPTITGHILGSQTVEAWAGPFEGTQSIPAAEWQPYIRTMPHAEYPSGSSCVCGAFRDALIHLYGTDDITSLIGGPAVLEVPAGSSKIEPGVVPATDLVFLYSTFSQIADDCSQSRLDGGMHFDAAVPAGDDLCASIGPKIADAFADLTEGIVPPYVADQSDKHIKEKRC